MQLLGQCNIPVFVSKCDMNVMQRLCKRKEEGKDQESRQSKNCTGPETLYEKVTKTQGNITHEEAKRSDLSQQVITKLQGTDKTV